ncbi:hypothetical protein TrVE_jg4413 [Triparma verrucosa]|uniref:Uncharacterized protein n=1 Tax=Triparma verrucosa TaxID=1606542 RepID=A0A9W7FD74_9STRA|nr:hypothetical protein TrVE_jg4413 [Triparma verrucosa]
MQDSYSGQDKIGRTEGDDDLQMNSTKTIPELEEEELKKYDELSSDPLQEKEALRQATSPPAGPHATGGQDHPTTLHHTNNDLHDDREVSALNVNELRMELQKKKKLLKKVKDEAASELAAERLLKEAAAAQLDVERKAKEANAEAVARLNAEKEEAAAQLDAERKAKDEAVRKLATVVAEINSDTTLQARRRRVDASATYIVEPFDRDNSRVKRVGTNVLSESTTTHTCRTNVTIHEEPQVFVEALLGDQTKVGKMLFQKVVEEGVVYWSFMFEGMKKCCDLLLRMQVERRDEAGIVVKVKSVEEAELEAMSLSNPHSTATKKFRLLFKEGTIVLQPLPLGQTSFTFTAQVDVGEVMKDAIIASQSSFRKSTSSVTRSTTIGGITSAISGVTNSAGAAVKMVGAGDEGANAGDLFGMLANKFYERFQKENIIDARRKEDFVKNGVPNSPPLTNAEQEMITESMNIVEEMRVAKRVAGTVNDSVEKFLHRPSRSEAAWGMTVAKMDVKADVLFAELWLIDTYARKSEYRSASIRGTIPTWVVNKKIPRALKPLQEAINEFRQDDRIDAAVREDLSTLMEERWAEEVYSKEELHLIDEGKATLKAIIGSANFKVVESGDPLVTLKAAHLDGDALATGIAESVVDGRMEEVAAFEWLKMSREATKNFQKKGGIKKFIKEMH